MAVTIDGNAYFGDSVKLAHAILPRGTQTNEYPGLDGLEELDMGFRGRMTVITGRLVSDNPSDLAIVVNTLASYQDGAIHTLIDNEGRVFPYAKMVTFQEEAGTRKYAPPYGYTMRYTVQIRHVL